MNRTLMWVVIAVGAAAVGYLAGQPTRGPGGAKGTTIELAWNAATSQCTADTKDKKLKVTKGDDEFAVWRVRDRDCYSHVDPAAMVELRFFTDKDKTVPVTTNPLDPARPSGRKWIFAEPVTPGDYWYEVWLVTPSAPLHKMEDPEIEIAS